MKNRIMFDIDGTLLNSTYKEEIEYFNSVLPKEVAQRFDRLRVKLLYEYEYKSVRYDKKLLSEFLSKKMNYNITLDMINDWIRICGEMEDTLSDNVHDTLDYLKRKQYSLVILTNWFKKAQEARLKKCGILKYFEDVYSGDQYVKPNKKAYYNAAGIYPIENCVMIGDNIEKDVITPIELGMKSIYYNPNNNDDFDKSKILSINNFVELKERF